MNTAKMSVFYVQWSEPREPEGRPRYMVNRQANVLCDTAERAIAMVRSESSEAVIHSLQRLGTNTLTIIDTDAASGRTPDDDRR